jgi:hypothetical protein
MEESRTLVAPNEENGNETPRNNAKQRDQRKAMPLRDTQKTLNDAKPTNETSKTTLNNGEQMKQRSTSWRNSFS